MKLFWMYKIKPNIVSRCYYRFTNWGQFHPLPGICFKAAPHAPRLVEIGVIVLN